MAPPKFGTMAEYQFERVAARRKQDQLLVEQREVNRQQQRHDDQHCTTNDQGEHNSTLGYARHGVVAIANRRHGVAAGYHAPIVSGLR